MTLPDEALRERLLEVAEQSIWHGLNHERPLPVDPAAEPEALREKRASFVTLKRHGLLRGCIGAVEPVRPLVEDVVHNAYAAGFRDPRFPPLDEAELDGLELQISLLTPPEPMHFNSEAELIEQLRPGVDGLILKDGGHRGTFLPAVWASVPEPRAFLRELRIKAGLPPDGWSDTLQVERYRTESFGRRL
ncbi:AMMECR1 domain-containing protein [Thioalkalivibrio denitrificans]|uniref:AMMECR1 domain-containing protein n=1 Tax=Thioalkalivibrio denitrificans TaxID=108003 RepID=A0A1V3NRJ9_9GAMM|nr:AmmeMemoRadiSam system protein A [Thioalkalivibrio denitrificans]OOG27634.1 AMMECR1 domain-containing protein [Thioalkalivibrio denitrificans]